MKEVEVKILEIDIPIVESQIKQLGAEKTFDGDLHALFFDDADRSITHKGDVLRIRKEGPSVVLTYKQHLSQEETKVMQEYEITVSEVTNMANILALLGFSSIKETLKHRIEYRIDRVAFVIDRYKGEMSFIPPFLELEAQNNEDLYRALRMLEIDPKDAKSWSTYDLIQHYSR